MKPLIRFLIKRSVHNRTAWKLIYKNIIKTALFVQTVRNTPPKINTTEVRKIAGIIFHDLIVKNGPFQGMKYPDMQAIGSSLYPKLLGSYEKELQALIEMLCRNNYSRIIDIGCAEGYYAVGMAIRKPLTEIYAYDTDSQAIFLCKAMAKANNVNERLTTGGFCDDTILKDITNTSKALIISDCEGYEKQLFSKELVQHLSRHDLLIEVHDFEDPDISSTLIERFHKTHFLKIINSVDDSRKIWFYNFDELTDLDNAMRYALLAEHRPGAMEWFFLKSKSVT